MTAPLIVFEGIDGSGKSTQLRLLEELFEFESTFQFGATEIGKSIRSILLDPQNDVLDDRTEALLIIADKAQHVEEIVRPALESGKAVVSDRYCASMLAYQGYGRGLNLSWLTEIMRFATRELEPDLTVLFDLDVHTALARLGEQPDRFEGSGIEFYRRVREGYLELARQHHDSWVVIDANGTPNEVSARLVSVLSDWLPQCR